ncbi:hypothetical protein VP01_928g6 [Puccinia sorghi]|uniref:Uncharacterized protein n=1 Tax=Puccinia sorghi TaxID=27349 RepID=A0A0L6U7J9_9BASI|nr:hypothetical protein VP01_928g6 [Puccinia sorghi]
MQTYQNHHWTTSFEKIQDFFAIKCNHNFMDSGALIHNAFASGSPQINWKVWLTFPKDDECMKTSDYMINDIQSFTTKINCVFELENDVTKASLELFMEDK